MKNIFIETFEKNLSKSINDFESINKIVIPNEYKEFIKEINGGFLKENEFKHKGEYITIEVFYGLQKEYSMYDLENNFDINMYGSKEKNILVIAQCLGQNYIGISLGNDKKHKIYYINVEDYIIDFDKNKVKYIEITKSFNDLIKKIQG